MTDSIFVKLDIRFSTITLLPTTWLISTMHEMEFWGFDSKKLTKSIHTLTLRLTRRFTILPTRIGHSLQDENKLWSNHTILLSSMNCSSFIYAGGFPDAPKLNLPLGHYCKPITTSFSTPFSRRPCTSGFPPWQSTWSTGNASRGSRKSRNRRTGMASSSHPRLRHPRRPHGARC